MAQSSGSDMSKNIYAFGTGTLIRCGGRFSPNGNLDPITTKGAAEAVKGPGFRVIRVATGRYRVIFKKRYQDYSDFHVQLQKNTPDSDVAKLGPVVLADTNHGGVTTAEIFTHVSSAAADIAAAAGTRVNFGIELWSGKRSPERG